MSTPATCDFCKYPAAALSLSGSHVVCDICQRSGMAARALEFASIDDPLNPYRSLGWIANMLRDEIRALPGSLPPSPPNINDMVFGPGRRSGGIAQALGVVLGGMPPGLVGMLGKVSPMAQAAGWEPPSPERMKAMAEAQAEAHEIGLWLLDRMPDQALAQLLRGGLQEHLQDIPEATMAIWPEVTAKVARLQELRKILRGET